MDTRSKFTSLIENLNVKRIMFIDNNFTSSTEPEEILSYIIITNIEDRGLLLSEIKNLGGEVLSSKIERLISMFYTLEHDVKMMNDYLEAGIIKRYLLDLEPREEIHEAMIVEAEEIIKEISECLDNNYLLDTFMKFGIVNSFGVYEVFYKELQNFSPKKSIRVYKNVPTTEWDNIISDITVGVKPSEFCLCIIDKRLESSVSGDDFIKKCLYVLRDRYNIISVLFTSYPEDKPQVKLDDYFTIEIDKEDKNAIDKLTEELAFCAYVALFERLKTIHSNSIDKAFKLALERRNNMNYIASMAHEEGLTSFAAINKWFELVKEESITESLTSGEDINSFCYLSRLTHFLNEEFLNETCKIIDVTQEDEIQHLNTFEMFDYTINSLHLPPVPGDIFEYIGDKEELKGKYLILTGQECDSVIRGDDAERKVNSVDFIEADYLTEIINEKVDQKDLIYQYFRKLNNEVGSLRFNVNQRISADFAIVDTCAFNPDGICKISIQNELDNQILKMLPPIWSTYYSKLQNSIKNVKGIKDFLNEKGIPANLVSPIDINAFSYNLEEDILVFPLRRVCRLKDRFKDLIIKKYWDYRERVGINTMPITNTVRVPIKLMQVGNPGEMIQNEVSLWGYFVKTNDREKNKKLCRLQLLINSSELYRTIQESFNIETNLSHDRIIKVGNEPCYDISTGIQIEKMIRDDKLEGIRVTFPYTIMSSNDKIYANEIKITKIISDKVIPQDSEWFFIDEPESKVNLFSDKNRPVGFNIREVLTRGIYNPNLNIRIVLDKSNIIIEEEALAAAVKDIEPIIRKGE